MDQKLSWSLSLGRWVGVPVRVHALLFLFIAVIFCVDFNSLPISSNGVLATAIVTSMVLLVSILAHELAHIFALHNLGGTVYSVMLMPWGGNSTFEYPSQKSWKLITILAGPFVNFAIFLFGAALLTQSTDVSLWKVIHPFCPNRFEPAAMPVSLVQIVTWINFQLMIANLVPCFPFDGAEILRTALGFIQKNIPQYRIEAAVRVSGTAIALTLIGIAWVLRDYQVGPVEPVWFVLLVSGISLYFASRHSYYMETYDDSSDWEDAHATLGLADSFANSPSFFMFGDSEDPEYSKWLVEKQEARMRDEMQLEQREIELADGVLEKLHDQGIESLTTDERHLLQRVSERLRRKRKQDVLD